MAHYKNLEKEDINFVTSDKFSYKFVVEKVTKIRFFISGDKFENESEQRVYNAMRRADDFERDRIASDLCVAYCDTNRIDWGTICNIRCLNHEQGDEGHYVIEAIIEEQK